MTAVANAQALPDPQVFQDIPVLPGRALYAEPYFADGGPVWPDFASQTAPRFWRMGRRADHPPTMPATVTPEPMQGSFIWGGYAQPHFGHLVSEHVTRLPAALSSRPDAPVLFFGPPGAQTLPPALVSLAGWFGCTRDRLKLITIPTRVAKLYVWPQGEQIGCAPEPYYMPLVDRIAEARLGPRKRQGLVYVSREGLLAQGLAGHLGERYLVERLRASGVAVLDPARAGLHDQVAAYDGADALVFAEGSAAHGRQLIGYRAQGIEILNRRFGSALGAGNLPPRCDSFQRHEVTSESASIALQGRPGIAEVCAVSVYDLDKLFAVFADHGLKLAEVWDHAAYRRAQQADLEAWLYHHMAWRGAAFWSHLGTVPGLVERHGWQDSLKRLRRLSRVEPMRRGLRRIRGAIAGYGRPAKRRIPE